MKNVTTAAKRAGLHNIECPSCQRQLNTVELFERLFASILELVRDGEIVNVPRFGRFSSIKYKAKSFKTPLMKKHGGYMSIGPRVTMKWHTSAHAKRVLNPEQSEQAHKAAVKGAKTRAARARVELAAVQQNKDLMTMVARLKVIKKKTARAKRLVKKRKANEKKS